MTTTKGTWMAVAAAVGLAAAGAWAHEHEGKAAAKDAHETAAGAPQTWEGEVVDLHCFLLHPETGQGPDHAGCAKMCMNKGLPIGFLTGGQVYLLLNQGHDSVKGLAAKHAGFPATLKGVVVEHHGIKAIQVASITKPGAAAKSPAPVAATATPRPKPEAWFCPMNCEGKTYDKAGRCPVCGMELEKKKS